ncbi:MULTISPECIES: DNA repair protein RecN [unclassified Corynebacterium]|uniref:DNA repair protein RecN n=1 Tax=unclassified Corynebacterium TaxID=2624378 RepID=UPI0029C9F019|nr:MULTISPECIES: DNA repair protein RecN [unclassified Corynebacterium]WPF67127.1 DNA repair protein RecN [Corynebacterium sp. 22KM0430]WPF69615.1 DNA repair protein RecN [Corynebacterium sp. 21KM1197]
MLAELTIENLGVIPRATTELSPGLTVLTGETGAGKTMVVTGLRLLTGGRADASRIRNGAKKAVVEGRFIAGAEGAAVVEEAGGEPDENGEFIASRTVSGSRSRAHLGGRSVPAATLTAFTQGLLTIHGQNDQLRLRAPEQQREALDRYAHIDLGDYHRAYQRWKELERDLRRRTQSRRELAQESDRLQFALKEIDAVDPQPGEEAELLALVRRLQDVDSLREQATLALAAIDGAEAFGETDESDPASTLLGRAASALTGDPVLEELGERLSGITAALGEITAELGAFLSELPTDPEALETALQRQYQLKSLTRKYAPDIEGVIAWQDKARERLSRMDTSMEALEELKKSTREAYEAVLEEGKKISAVRYRAARNLGRNVSTELHGLAMPKAQLIVDIRTGEPGPQGLDEVALFLAANPEAPPRPLDAAASGGELSRVMLALEVVLAGVSPGTTLVFDEVDAGVGGRAAMEIGRRLARLAQHNQVIAVTHLPQVAAYADTHLHVAKDDTVTSGVETLTGQRRVEELARMLAGLVDATGLAHAAELLERAQEFSRAPSPLEGGNAQ